MGEPEVVQEQPKYSVRDEQDQFTDLVNWQKASIVSTSTVTEEGIVLTDDGRTMTEEEAKPKCPICEETFDIDDVTALEMHVEAHLTTNLFCPVCNAAFGVDSRESKRSKLWVRKKRKVHRRLNASWKICFLAVNGQSFLVIDGYLLNSLGGKKKKKKKKKSPRRSSPS